MYQDKYIKYKRKYLEQKYKNNLINNKENKYITDGGGFASAAAVTSASRNMGNSGTRSSSAENDIYRRINSNPNLKKLTVIFQELGKIINFNDDIDYYITIFKYMGRALYEIDYNYMSGIRYKDDSKYIWFQYLDYKKSKKVKKGFEKIKFWATSIEAIRISFYRDKDKSTNLNNVYDHNNFDNKVFFVSKNYDELFILNIKDGSIIERFTVDKNMKLNRDKTILEEYEYIFPKYEYPKK